MQAAATQADPQSAANAYAAALRAFGYGMMAHLDFHAYFGFSAAWPRRSLPAAPPDCSSEDAAVDSMACYVCCVDAGSGYGRLYPAHHMTALVAAGALESYSAELASLMGFHGGFKPLVVRSDQGSAFVSFYFREFLAARQIHQSLACTYTPQQNSHAERFFGVVFATARVLLAAAGLPPTFGEEQLRQHPVGSGSSRLQASVARPWIGLAAVK